MPLDTHGSVAPATGSQPNATVAPILELHEVCRTFGGVTAVDRATFYVESGTITGLIGPNGAGKSTVLSLIAGTLPLTSGVIRFAGEEITGLPSHRLARLGIARTFQMASVFGHMTVLENMVLGFGPQPGETLWGALTSKRTWRKREAELAELCRDVLTRFGLQDLEDVYAEELSGGQRRIVEILRALGARPRILLLDEPMAGIHPSMRLRIEALLSEVRSLGTTMLVVEHELDVLERIADSVVVMTQGCVLAKGTMREIRCNKEVERAYLTG